MKEKEVMTNTVTNQSCTMAYFRGHSGETWRVPPGHVITMMTTELTDNAKARKLAEPNSLPLTIWRLTQNPAADTNRRARA